MIKINPPKMKDRKKIEKTTKRDHIYRMKKDILDVEDLRKTVTLTKE